MKIPRNGGRLGRRAILQAVKRTPPPKTSTEATLPLYATRFQCIGPACEDTCCSGWRISIDKETFKAYRLAQSGPLVDRFRTRLKLAPTARKTAANWGEIELDDESRNCSFLEEGSCAVHSTLGEDALSDTCYSFPRRYTAIGTHVYHGLSPACPEVARLALGVEDALELAETTVEFRTATAAGVIRVLPVDVMIAVTDFCAKAARTKGLVLWERLALLGIFCDDLTGLMAAGRHTSVRALVEKYEPMLTVSAASDALSAAPMNHALQAQMFLSLLRMGATEEHSPLRARIQRGVAVGLGVDPLTWQVDEMTLIERYTSGVGRLKTALEKIPFLLDNFVQNEMHVEGFPFAGKTPMVNYLQLVSRFGIVRLMLAARCNEDPIPEPPELIGTVRYFCRRFTHDAQYINAVNTALAQTNDTTIDRLYAFLRW